jgi:hypothetical protein
MTDATAAPADASTDDVGVIDQPATPDASTPDAIAKPDAANDDWRTTFATAEDGTTDDKLLKFLGRYHSPNAAIAAWKKNNDDIATGKYVKPLGDDPTDDELASYRKDFGIPDDPAGYLEKLPDGLVVGEDDKPFVEKFLSEMHGTNAPPAAVNAALKSYYSIVAEQEAARADADAQAREVNDEALRSEWGPDYKRNLTAAKSYLGTLPESVRSMFEAGRLPDGTAVGNNSDVVFWLTSLALAENPLATVVPGAGANQAAAIGDEITALKKEMGDLNSSYWKGPEAEKKQARYRELVEASQKLQSRG